MPNDLLHPLAFGFLDSIVINLFAVPKNQRIALTALRFHNESDTDTNVYAAILRGGKTLKLTPGSAMMSLKAGHTVELLEADFQITLDENTFILGYADTRNRVSFILDGKVDQSV